MIWQNQAVFPLLIVNASGGFTGLFVYSPAPGAGNLVASITAQAGTDPYGNAYKAGITSYGSAGATSAELTTNLLLFSPGGGQVAGTSAGQVEVASGNNGADTPLTAFFVSKNSSSGAAGPGIELQNNGGALVADRVFAWDPASSRTARESWHSLGTLAGYTVVIGRYRLTDNDEVELDIKCAGGGAQAQTVTFSNVLPPAYRPTTQHDTLPMGTTKAIAAGDIWPRLLVDTAGNVTVNATPNSATTIGCNVRVPLD